MLDELNKAIEHCQQDVEMTAVDVPLIVHHEMQKANLVRSEAQTIRSGASTPMRSEAKTIRTQQ